MKKETPTHGERWRERLVRFTLAEQIATDPEAVEVRLNNWLIAMAVSLELVAEAMVRTRREHDTFVVRGWMPTENSVGYIALMDAAERLDIQVVVTSNKPDNTTRVVVNLASPFRPPPH